jgi:hypothetical protein
MSASPLTRRGFLRHSCGIAGLLAGLPSCPVSAAEPAPLLVNHVGFPPASGKFCLMAGTRPTPFSVVEKGSGRVAHAGEMKPFSGDLGAFVLGDFSRLEQPGSFELRVPGSSSKPFVIDADVYTPAVRACVEYFSKQRCGASRTGFNAPCHLDDGVRSDDRRRKDVTGGWHDACDLRKWVSATIYGMIGLTRALDALGTGRLDRDRVIDELRWGNQYFHKMQEPDGYLMDYCGGDDGNHFTDNRPGTPDDRLVHVGPCELPAQFQFIATQAAMVRHTREEDPAYARLCAESANRCLEWCVHKRLPRAATSLGAALIACAELHRTTPEDRLEALAAEYAGHLLELQVDDHKDRGAPIGGFFLTAPDRPHPLRETSHGNLPMLGLCEVLDRFPRHPDAPRWRRALESHVGYVLGMCDRSAFGTVPFGLYAERDPGGNRRVGAYWYRWFMKVRGETNADEWWVGVNGHLASHGVGLVKASRVLGDGPLRVRAQRQLDWILGANPFDASTVTGVGRNQPPLFVTGEFRPATPPIPGGVMNGLGGTALDEPALEPGSYHTCEYWTPMVAYTMWLMAELQIGR